MNNINTIFYYAESLSFSDYITMLQSGEITYRTIVFAQAQKAIYKGGVQYGATDLADLKEQLKTLLDGQEVIQKIENIVNNHFDLDPQDLPTASTTKKGCIKVGNGLKMSGDTMSVDFSNVRDGIDGIDGIVEQIIKTQAGVRASKNNYGVVRVGDGIDVTNGIISVSLTQGPKGDKGDTGAQGPQGERGPAGPAYDDSALQSQIDALDDAIDAVNETARGEKARLDSIIEDLSGEISDRVDAMFEDAQWVQEHVANQIVSESNFGESDVEAYLQRIGVWEENEDHTAQLTKWSKLTQTVSSLSGSVDRLLTQGIDQQALQALIEAKIQEGVAGLDLSTLYARKQAETVIEWLYSGLRGRTNDTTTFADIVSAGKNSFHQAIADIHTYVKKLEDGDYVATASLEASVDSAIAGLKASASSNTAKTEIFNKINQNSTDIAAIVSSITNDNSSTTIANKIGNWRSGLITSANLDGAISTLLGTNGTFTSAIMTEGEFNVAKTSLVAKSEYDAATIVAMVNNAGSLVEINANKINLVGQTTFTTAIGDYLLADTAFINSLFANDASVANSVVTGEDGENGVAIYGSAGWYGIKMGEINRSSNNPLSFGIPSPTVCIEDYGVGGRVILGQSGSDRLWMDENGMTFYIGGYSGSNYSQVQRDRIVLNNDHNSYPDFQVTTNNGTMMVLRNNGEQFLNISDSAITFGSTSGLKFSVRLGSTPYIEFGNSNAYTNIYPGHIVMHDANGTKTITTTS